MSEQLQTINNIKIPYPVEGVIRTAQLDDTVSPDDSAQLAVNMNFDRVGAIQTRLGVATYAEALAEAINNFGTLRNSIIPSGYARLFQVGDTSEIEEVEFEGPSAVLISSTRMAVFWRGTDGDGFCRLFEIDDTTGIVTPIGSVVEFDATQNGDNCAIKISSTRVLNTWSGSGNDGFVQCFDVSGDTIIPEGSPLEFDTANGQQMTLATVDSTHVICFYESTNNDGVATIFAIDGSGTVTEPGSPFTFESGTVISPSCVAVGDGTHFITFWSDGGDGRAQCFTVNTGTWAITANGSSIIFDGVGDHNNGITCGDGEHFVNFFQGDTGGRAEAQAFELNLSTFAIATVGTPVLVSPTSGNDLFALGFGNGEDFVAMYSRNVGEGFVQMVHMDPTTFDMSLVGERLSGYDFGGEGSISGVTIALDKIIAVWANGDEIIGKAAMFQSFGDPVDGRWLYAGHGDEVSNYPPGGPWTVVRSTLAEVSKPRFAQYLGYIWMVNGNDAIGGDPVATSNGGAFGTDLVPEDFPKGDFISAGFEGRVWVADKTLGIIYYSDIVQFIPPLIFTLSYNPDVNFITTISPQTGETFTALYEVPRALLVFTENTITRIYGATSIDAYPAYNVGTFSQESIVETKTGIFFHHSSGFYQFDYGSQPVEISRRIIDFVKAIPRSYYDDITGVYDGFDAVEWSVGSLTVEGVVYSNCVLRYTISTQVWTIYDYPLNVITAMIYYDDGTNLNHLMGTAAGKVGAMDSGFTDFGAAFYYEYIDRWRAFTDMYCQIKSISGFSVYSENAAGANLMYQHQKAGPNAWQALGSVDDKNTSLFPNANTEDFDVLRLRIAGNTSGTQVVIHGIEITALTIKGFNEN